MVYLYYISCLRYTILVGNPRFTNTCQSTQLLHFHQLPRSVNPPGFEDVRMVNLVCMSVDVYLYMWRCMCVCVDMYMCIYIIVPCKYVRAHIAFVCTLWLCTALWGYRQCRIARYKLNLLLLLLLNQLQAETKGRQHLGKMVGWPASSGPGMKMNLLLLTSEVNSDSTSPSVRKPSAWYSQYQQ